MRIIPTSSLRAHDIFYPTTTGLHPCDEAHIVKQVTREEDDTYVIWYAPVTRIDEEDTLRQPWQVPVWLAEDREKIPGFYLENAEYVAPGTQILVLREKDKPNMRPSATVALITDEEHELTHATVTKVINTHNEFAFEVTMVFSGESEYIILDSGFDQVWVADDDATSVDKIPAAPLYKQLQAAESPDAYGFYTGYMQVLMNQCKAVRLGTVKAGSLVIAQLRILPREIRLSSINLSASAYVPDPGRPVIVEAYKAEIENSYVVTYGDQKYLMGADAVVLTLPAQFDPYTPGSYDKVEGTLLRPGDFARVSLAGVHQVGLVVSVASRNKRTELKLFVAGTYYNLNHDAAYLYDRLNADRIRYKKGGGK